MKTVGLVLSGGGVRGVAHLGMLQALDELNIRISAISGVSSGALAGALYAAGCSPAHILKEFKTLSYFDLKDLLWMKNGLFSMNTLHRKLEKLIEQDSFEHLGIPLFVTATDILTSSSITFSEGPLFNAILGSCSVPVVFEPVHFMHFQLADGGILNNLPVEPLTGRYDVLIGSHVNKLYDDITPPRFDKITLADQCFHLAIAGSTYHRARECAVFIEPVLAGHGIFDMSAADDIFQLGYKAAMAQKEVLLALTA